MKKTLLFLIIVLGSFSISKAQNLNEYRYVLVPEQFKFLKEPNQYQLNELTKFLFEKIGFEAYLEGSDVPVEVRGNPCDGLTANVKNNSNMFTTKLQIILKDCNNREVFVSEEGTSREKDFKASYHDALRKAFQSLNSLDYSYEPGEATVSEGEGNRTKNSQTRSSTVTGEVAKSTPSEKTARQQEKTVVPANVPGDRELVFELDNAVYYLEKTDNGYNFYQKEMSEPFASLVSSSLKNTFIYSSITNQGVAQFDEEGNLIVELLNKQSNSPRVRVYKRLDQ